MSMLHWKIHWPSTVMTLLLLPALLGLGRWQLHRADEKRITQDAFAAALDAAPRDIAELPAQPEQYSRLRMRGHYDNARSFLLDNRVLHGKFGYEILTPFLPVNASTSVLVNRGWTEGDPARMQRPLIGAVEGDVEITGSIYWDTARFHFVDNPNEAHWPKLIENLQMEDLAKQLSQPILPYTVRIDANMPGAYRAEWQVFANGFGPERHVAYAVTWFALAGALAVIWVISNSNIAQLLKRTTRGD